MTRSEYRARHNDRKAQFWAIMVLVIIAAIAALHAKGII